MKTFTVELSDDAAGMLEEMHSAHRVKPENVIRYCVEGAMADAINDEGLVQCYIENSTDPAARRLPVRQMARCLALWRALEPKLGL
jgi:hypothetical protein